MLKITEEAIELFRKLYRQNRSIMVVARSLASGSDEREIEILENLPNTDRITLQLSKEELANLTGRFTSNVGRNNTLESITVIAPKKVPRNLKAIILKKAPRNLKELLEQLEQDDNFESNMDLVPTSEIIEPFAKSVDYERKENIPFYRFLDGKNGKRRKH